MAKHVVTMIPGEGTGPEICEAVRMVIDASGVDIQWEYEEIGLDCLEKYGTLLPDKTIQNIAKNKVALKGPTTTPIGGGHKSANVTLRKVFDLYANVRPVRLIPALKRPWRSWTSSTSVKTRKTPMRQSSTWCRMRWRSA